MGDPCQICGNEPASRLTLLGASDPLTIVACDRHRRALAYEIGQTIGHLMSAEKTQRAGPSARAETGAMQFGSDWRGIFIRGDSAFHFATQLALVAHWLEKQGPYPTNGMAILQGLRNLLLTAHQQRSDVEVQMLRAFDQCGENAALQISMGPMMISAPYPIHLLGKEMRRACYFSSKDPPPDTLIMTKEVERVTCAACLAIIKGEE